MTDWTNAVLEVKIRIGYMLLVIKESVNAVPYVACSNYVKIKNVKLSLWQRIMSGVAMSLFTLSTMLCISLELKPHISITV